MRHAYLIIAHNSPELLQSLIMKLDDERNDIYVHIDKKASFDKIDFETKKSRLIYLENRIDAGWGDFSLVRIELALIKDALQNGSYTYLHLLSGADMPVKSQDEIHGECQMLSGTEFIGFSKNVSDKELEWRSQHYFLFSHEYSRLSGIKRFIRASFARLQSLVGYRRCPLQIKKGSQWWSITSEFARYIISKEEYITKHFDNTFCPDEMVFQTICWNSEFRNKIYCLNDEFKGCRRYIPWLNTYIRLFNDEDFELMQSSDFWFARKFSQKDLTKYEQVFHN